MPRRLLIVNGSLITSTLGLVPTSMNVLFWKRHRPVPVHVARLEAAAVLAA